MVRIANSEEAAVLSFFREQDGDLVIAAFNFSPDPVTVTLGDHPPARAEVDVLTGDAVDLKESLFFPGWGYVVLAG